MSSITLSIASISVILDTFINTDYPRIEARENGGVAYSIAGTPAVSGFVYEPKHIWVISALCSSAQWDALEAIYLESERRRRNLLDYDVLIEDLVTDFKELQPRTRSLIPDTLEELLYGSYSKYYAQFKAAFTERPKRTETGRLLSVSCQLQETVKVLA
jgi:hypothetical protein